MAARRFAPWAALVVGALAVWAAAGQFLPDGLPAGIALQGLVFGGLTAMSAMGIVLVYRSARFINFAQAEIGGFAASVAVVLATGSHVSYYVAVPAGLVAAVISGLLVDLIMQRFNRAPRLIATVATIGIAQILGGGEAALPWLYGTGGLSNMSGFHFPSGVNFHLGPVLFKSDEILVMIVVPLVLAGLWWFLGRTDTGVAIRGAADSRDRAMLLGVPVRRLSMATWVVAAVLSGVGAILKQPIAGQNIGTFGGPQEILLPLVAAVVAGMESMPVAFAASLGLGVFEQAIRWSYPQSQSPAVDVGALVVVLVALLLRRQRHRRVGESEGEGILVRQVRPIGAALRSLPEVRALRWGVPALLVTLAVVLPLVASASNLLLLSNMVIYGVIAVSLVILTGWAGQISLGQFAFAGMGGALTAWAMVHHGINLEVALVIGAAVGAGTAIVIGLPALRSPGLQLAAVTLAFAVPVNTYFLSSEYFPSITPPFVARPSSLNRRFDLNDPLTFYYLCLIVLVVALLVSESLRRSRPGRAIQAVRDNDRGAAAYGISPFRSKLSAFAISGGLAGIAGGLYVVNLQGIQFGGFDPTLSLLVFTMVVVGGLGSLSGALVGAAYVLSITQWLKGSWTLFASGAGLLLVLMVIPEGLGSIFYRLRDLLARWAARRRNIDPRAVVPRPSRANGDASASIEVSATTHRAALRLGALEDLELSSPASGGVVASDVPNPIVRCEGVDASYGETQVLFAADVAVGAGEVVALLGTNGAGKSTLLKVMNGLLRPTSGRVSLFGQDVTSWSPQERARAGLATVPGGRGVFSSLTVRENLRMAGWLFRRDRAFIEEATGKALSLFPALRERIDTRAGLLSGGEQQMLTIAQAMLCKPKVLLIDELSMGLAPAVVGELLRVVRSLSESGVTVMVVEQSVNVATVISRRAVFMERGHVRFSGPTPSLAQQPELLRSVFLRAASKAQSLRGDGPAPATSPGPEPSADRAPRNSGAPRKPVLEVRRATKSYGGVVAINDVSLSVDEGEILGVIGSNGAGKTTLFDVCSGFTIPEEGSILLDGRDITQFGPNWRAKNGLGRVFQESKLWPSMTVSDALCVAFECSIDVKEPIANMLRLGAAVDCEGEVRDKAEDLMDRLGLARWHDSFVSELSTGTRRILELGCVMAHNPRLLLLDEPSAGIAQRESEALAELLRGIAEQSRASMVIIEHDVPLVSSVADRLLCMHLGEVISTGSTASVLNDPLVIDAYLGRDEETMATAGPLQKDPV